MSENKLRPEKSVVPEESEAPKEPKAPKAPTTGYHFVVVPNGSNFAPESFIVDTLEELQRTLYDALERTEQGWCWVSAGGQPCKLHMPRQVFILELPDGSQVALRPSGEEPVSKDGSFYTLVPVRSF